MSDFFRMVLSELSGAAVMAAAAAVVCTVSIFISARIYRKKYNGERKFPLGRAVAAALLICWAAAVLRLTVLRSTPRGGANLYLFRAWRDAWNTFYPRYWGNVFLNALMFMPLGVLLPLAVKSFRRPLAAFFVFLMSTLSIELFQFVFSVGYFDVDDLLTNFVGASVGYGAVMAVITAAGSEKDRRSGVRAAAYASIPALTLGAVATAFAVYYIKPYGNLSCAPVYRAGVDGVSWTVSGELTDEEQTVPIYRTRPCGRAACIAMGEKFFALLGVDADELKITYYDGYLSVSDSGGDSIEIHYVDGRRVIRLESGDAAAVSRKKAEALLAECGIEIPEGASYTRGGDGSYTFSLERSGESGHAGLLHVIFVRVDGKIRVGTVDDRFCDYEYVRDERVISSAKAFSRLQNGEFYGDVFAYYSPKSVEYLSCRIVFEADTKSFFQPVWEFTVKIDGERTIRIEIPALK